MPPKIRAYEIRLTAEGKTHRDIRRSVKRALAATPLPTNRRRRTPERIRRRGLTNIGASAGLVRQYLPKGVNLSSFSPSDLQAIEDKLNNRPRTRLGWATPAEVMAGAH
jgi:hypothetical protein